MREQMDTERLDWLETNRYQAGFHQFGKDSAKHINKWIVWDCKGTQCRKIATGPTIRKTIDAAMEAEK
ncbi:hypothetical protein [Gluconobacter oxydans]|uniref:hypothetical protein n=1 Tax=Gluconobacter oxydans TaxID=442 RepID=UPI0039E77B5D